MLLAALFLVGTTAVPVAAQTRLEFTEIHMAMSVRIVVYAQDGPDAREAVRAAFRRVVELEDILSHFRPQSELRRLEAAAPGEWVRVGPELLHVLGVALGVAEATGGAFDPTVGPLVELWREAREAGRSPAPEELDAARARTGWHRVELDTTLSAARLTRSGIRFDLGGAAKGYILEAALSELSARGFPRALVEAGGDLVVGEPPPGRPGWRVAVPGADPELAERASRLTGAALATSGADARHLEVEGVRHTHIIDPRTGLGVTHGYTAHVIAADAATADALATALSVLGPEGLALVRQRFPGVQASVLGPAPGRLGRACPTPDGG